MKYQLVCPKCKHEFTYDNGYYDKHITRLGCEIRDITLQLAEHNQLTYDQQRERTDWWIRTKRCLAEKQKELAELKAIRKISDQQIKRYEYQTFKNIVKEFVGPEQYMKFIEQMKEELAAYKTSGLMRHEYTRSNSKPNVISINKI